MATNHTPNYQLSQWEKYDKVLCADFNEDNQKIDTILGRHTAQMAKLGNCRVYYSAHTGNGGSGGYMSFSFSYRPILFIITGGEYVTTALYNSATAQCRDGKGNFCEFPLAWGTHSVRWKITSDKITPQGNGDEIDYQVMFLLDTEC